VKKEDKLALKIAIVTIIEGGLAKQVELAKALGIRRQTISKYLGFYRESGVASLIDGRTGSHGISKEIENRVVELLTDSIKKVEIPKIIASEYGMNISKTKIYEIRKEHLSYIENQLQMKKNQDGKKN